MAKYFSGGIPAKYVKNEEVIIPFFKYDEDVKFSLVRQELNDGSFYITLLRDYCDKVSACCHKKISKAFNKMKVSLLLNSMITAELNE